MKATEQYFAVLLFTVPYKLALSFNSVEKVLSVTIQITVLSNTFLWLIFLLCSTFESVD